MTRQNPTKPDSKKQPARLPELSPEDLTDFEEHERSLYQLSPAQEIALDGLMTGLSITAAAKKARVARQTLSAWVNHDPSFIATRNRRRQLLADEINDRLRVLMLKSFDAIEEELQTERKLEAAKVMLRAVTALPPATGPILPAQVEIDQERRADDLLRSQWLLSQTSISARLMRKLETQE